MVETYGLSGLTARAAYPGLSIADVDAHDPAATTGVARCFSRYIQNSNRRTIQCSSGCSLRLVQGVIFYEARPCYRVPSIAEAIGWSD
jgi:hypothetical protein